ncbi:MAG: DUF5654 family protein [Candidatus Woesearchaeota archaeon]
MKTKLIERYATLTTGGFALVSALAWNEAIRGLFRGPCDANDAGPLCMLAASGPWIYALLVTFLAVIVTMWINYVAEQAKKPRKKEKITEKN